MVANAVNFFAPGTDAELEREQIQRQRDMANMLLKQSQTAPQGQMVSGHYVAPSWTQGLAQILSGVGSRLTNEKADTQQRALGDSIRAKNASDVQGFVGALQGSPASIKQTDGPWDSENPMPTQTTAAVAPDRAKALALALGSQSPMLQQAGGNMLTSQLATQELGDKLKMIPGFGGMQATLGATSPGVAPTTDGGASAAPGGLLGGGPPAAALPYGGANPTAVMSDIAFNGGKGIGNMVADANKPIAMREGDLVRPNAQGGFSSAYQSPKMDPGFIPQRNAQGQVVSASVIPGYAEGAGQLAGVKAGATSGAQAQNEMVTVDTPQGPRMMTKAQAVQLSGGVQPAPVAPQTVVAPRNPNPNPVMPVIGGGGGPVNGMPIPNPMAPRPGDSDRAMIYGQERSNIAKQMAQAQASGDPAAIARAQQDSAALEKEIQSQRVQLPPVGPGIALEDDASKKFGQTVASQSADALLASRDKAKAASDTLNTIQQARSTIAGGAFQGSGAETKLAIAKFVNANIPGMNIDPTKVANTDYLKSTLGAGLLAEAKTLGTNPSNADATRINDIVGSVGKDPQAMSKILDWRESMAQKAINGHNSTVQDAESRGMRSPYDLRVKAPEAPVSPQASAPTGRSLKDFGYATPADALKDAQRALQANPGARPEIMKRLAAMGVQLPAGAQGGW